MSKKNTKTATSDQESSDISSNSVERHDSSEQLHVPTSSTADQNIVGHVKKPHKKLFLTILAIALLIIVSVGVFFFTRTTVSNQPEELNIKIGDTTITQADIDSYATSVNFYKEKNPDVLLEQSSEEIALDDLVLNAALKKEAKDRGKSLTEKDYTSAYDIKESGEKFDSNWYSNKLDFVKANSSSGYWYYEFITIENATIIPKVSDELISERTLFYTAVNFDSPFFRNETDLEKRQQYHDQAKARLNDDILPLFEQKLTKKEISTKVDILLDDENFLDDKVFEEKATLYAEFYTKYSDDDDADNGRYQSSDILKEVSSQLFQDLDNVDYGVTVDDLRNTVDEINKLEKVGDYTSVFASKTGNYMIARLESKSGGDFSSWQAFIDKYKSEYVPSTEGVSFSSKVKVGVSKTLSDATENILDIGSQTAYAKDNWLGCAGHNIRAQIRAYKHGTVYPNIVALSVGTARISQSGAGCGTGQSSTGKGFATIIANCWTGAPSATLTLSASEKNAGYSITGAITPAWTPNINTQAYWQKWVSVKKSSYWVSATSNLRKTTGGGFGSGASISINKVNSAWANWSQPRTEFDDSVTKWWNVSTSVNTAARAPAQIPEAGVTYTGISGTTQNGKIATKSSPHKTYTFMYQPPIPKPPVTTCTISISAPNGTGDTKRVVNWSSNNSSGGSINSGVGDVGPSGSKEVNISSNTKFDGVFQPADSNGNVANCSATTSYVAVLKPYMRVYGNDVLSGAMFKDENNVCPESQQLDNFITGSVTDVAGGLLAGSSGQLGVFNSGRKSNDTTFPFYGAGITEFFSNNLSSKIPGKHGGTGSIPKDLTFGNVYSDESGVKQLGDDVPGGNSGVLDCIPNYFEDTKNSGAKVVNTGGNYSKISVLDSSLTTPIENGQRKLLLVDGNLFIDKNIEYKNTDWDNISDIPNVFIIVRGNIRISKDVTKLDGVFVAQPKPEHDQTDVKSDSGIIWTCVKLDGTLYTNTGALSGGFGEPCKKQLVITGSIISKVVKFWRTNGALICSEEGKTYGYCSENAEANEPASSGNIAEVINFSPEAYLTPLNSNLETSAPFVKYDSIVNLPPVL